MPVDLELYYKLNKPKSDQLNAIDLIGGPITVTITDANNGSAEQILWLSITGGHKPYKPCFNMRNMMEFAWDSRDPNTWIGKSLTLWLNPEVVYKGEVTGGIRISHVSHIAEVKSIKLNVGRNKREVFSVKPLSDVAPQQPIDFTELIEAATTSDELDTLAKQIVKAKPPADELRFLKEMVTQARNILKDKAL